jgi:hypothetical protein
LAALQETFLGVEAEGLPDAAQGDMKGTEFKGGIEEAVEADIQELQFVQEGGLAGRGLLKLLMVKLSGQMPGVAAEGGGAKAELSGQEAVGLPLDEAPVDLRAGGVRTDGTADRRDARAARVLHHERTPKGGISGKGRMNFRLPGQGRGGQHGWENWQRSGWLRCPSGAWAESGVPKQDGLLPEYIFLNCS